MRSLEIISKLARKFEQQIRQAQKPSVMAQPDDVRLALEKASLWELGNDVAKLIDAVQVPESATIKTFIILNPGPAVEFVVTLDPANTSISAKLAELLMKKYSAAMNSALTKAGLNVESPITVKWINF